MGYILALRSDVVKQADEFNVLDKTVTNCTDGMVYTATYRSTYIDYETVFKNYGGRIICVGSEQDAMRFASLHTEIIDLGGRVAVPGLIDCHTHPMSSYTTRFS